MWDQYVTMMIISVYAGLVTNYAKLVVAAPRPSYYAMKIFSSIFVADREVIDRK